MNGIMGQGKWDSVVDMLKGTAMKRILDARCSFMPSPQFYNFQGRKQ